MRVNRTVRTGSISLSPHFSSCFPLPQQAFLPEMGLKCRLLAASSPVFKKAGTFVSKLGAEPHAPAAGRKTKAPCLGRGQKNMPSNRSERHKKAEIDRYLAHIYRFIPFLFQQLFQIFFRGGDRCDSKILYQVIQNIGREECRKGRAEADVFDP